MATRTLEIDLRQGTGASSEPMYGVVTVQRAKAKSAGGFEILPFETSLKLINGKATITEAETDGTGPFYDSVYLFRVQNGYCAPRWGFMAALPDGTTPITTGVLPMVDPITGEGIYMDAQEWNARYGALPNRVTSLENSQTVQDQRLDSLEVLGGISPGDVSDSTVKSLIINPVSETSGALSAAYVSQLVPLDDQARAYRKRIKHSLPFQFPGWEAAKLVWGHEIFPQAFTVDTVTNELFITYSGSAQVVAVYDWMTGVFKTAFQLGINNTQTSEGIGITYESGARYLYARTALEGMGRFNITTLPANRSSVTAESVTTTGMGRTFTQTKTGWISNLGAKRDQYMVQNPDLTVTGFVTLPRGLTGGTAPVTATDVATPKVQGICESRGMVVTGMGGQFAVGNAVTPYTYQGVRLFSKSGELYLDALVNPAGYATVLTPHLNVAPRLIESEGVAEIDGTVYSLVVTHGWNDWEADVASVEGVLIMEEFSADMDALDFTAHAVSSPSPDLRITGSTLHPLGVNGLPANPVTGETLDTLAKIGQYMLDSGQDNLQLHLTDATPLLDVNGDALPPWQIYRFTRATTRTIYLEVFGLGGHKFYRVYKSGSDWFWANPDDSGPIPITFTLGTTAYNATYRKTGNLVELDGGVSLSGLAAGVYHVVATLPSGFRPTKFQYYPVCVANSQITANLRVDVSGVIEIKLVASSSSNVMLTGVRFRTT